MYIKRSSPPYCAFILRISLPRGLYLTKTSSLFLSSYDWFVLLSLYHNLLVVTCSWTNGSFK